MIIIIYTYKHTPYMCANNVPEIVRNFAQYCEMTDFEKFATT